MNPAQQAVLDRLAQPLSQRPVFAPDLGTRLSLELERSLAPLVGQLGRDKLFLSKRGLDLVHGCEARFVADGIDEFAWSVPIARGALAHKAIELSLGLGHDTDALTLVEEALASIQRGATSLADWLHRISGGERAELVGGANEMVAAFSETFPPLERKWKPVVEGSLRHELFDGAVVLSGKPDLTLGQPRNGAAGKVIIDFKTGATGGAHTADLRFYALLETLRTGVPPRTVATHYLSQGRLHAEDVTVDLLTVALTRTVEAARKMVALRAPDATPVKVTSASCRWCPLLDDCAEGRAWIAGVDDDRFDPD